MSMISPILNISMHLTLCIKNQNLLASGSMLIGKTRVQILISKPVSVSVWTTGTLQIQMMQVW